MHADLAGYMGKDFVSVFQFYLESSVGQCIDNDTVQLDHVLFSHECIFASLMM